MVSVALSLSRGDDDVKIRREREEYLEWKRLVRDAGVNHLVWVVHFGRGVPGQVCCRDCVDFVEGLCKGGGDPVRCMLDALSEIVPS